MMPMKKWKFGIVGAGLIADFHARAIHELPNARLVGVHNRTFDKARRLAAAHGAKAYETFEGLLKDVDVVTIATASGAHLEPAVAAAQAGVHVLCEKPLEITLERIDTMIAAHQKALRAKSSETVIPRMNDIPRMLKTMRSVSGVFRNRLT